MTSPWNNQLVALVIVSAPSGAFAGIFVYAPAPGAGNLIGSWAAEPGTDPFGNTYPQGLNVKVGSISGTTFTGTNFIINMSGMFFYSGTPALGNLILSITRTSGTDSFGNVYDAGIGLYGPAMGTFIYNTVGGGAGTLISAIAGASGTDAFGNAYPQGLYSQQLTLANQPVDPPAFTGASVFFSTVAGRPAYKSSAGARNVIDRSDINVAGFNSGNTTSPVSVSSQLIYQAGEGAQGSEYQIEIDATITSGTTVTSALNFQLADGGVVFGPHITIGAIAFAVNTQYFMTLRCRVTLSNPGSSLSNVTFDGGISKSANVGSESAFPVINNSMNVVGANNITFDPTITHTLTITASFSSLQTGQNVNVNRTRTSRHF